MDIVLNPPDVHRGDTAKRVLMAFGSQRGAYKPFRQKDRSETEAGMFLITDAPNAQR